MKEPLKKRQQEVLAYLRDCIRNGGTPPSAREMMAHFGFKAPRAVTDPLNIGGLVVGVIRRVHT